MIAGTFTDFNNLRATFASASYFKNDQGAELTVFNIGSGKYRLVTSLWYEGQEAYVKKVLTHAEYDRWNDAGSEV